MASYTEYLLNILKDEMDYQETRIRHCYERVEYCIELYQKGNKNAGEAKKTVLENYNPALKYYQAWQAEVEKFFSENGKKLGFFEKRKIEKFVSAHKKEMEDMLTKMKEFLSKIGK